jgi:hypothetical protein
MQILTCFPGQRFEALSAHPLHYGIEYSDDKKQIEEWLPPVMVDDAITTGITIAVVTVVAAQSPHDAWRQPVLRLVDPTVRVAIGVATAQLDTHAPRAAKLAGCR